MTDDDDKRAALTTAELAHARAEAEEPTDQELRDACQDMAVIMTAIGSAVRVAVGPDPENPHLSEASFVDFARTVYQAGVRHMRILRRAPLSTAIALDCTCCGAPATCQVRGPSSPGNREPEWMPCCDSVDCEDVLRAGIEP